MTISIKIGDSNSIEKAQKQIETYQKRLKALCELFVRRVGELGVDIARSYVTQMQIPYGIYNDIILEKGDIVVNGANIQIVVDNEHAIYWEYGTGIKGKDKPHPSSDTWIYDVNAHGDKGWYYSKEQGELTQWSKEKNGAYKTYGMPSQPFMWLTYNDLLNSKWGQICDIAREVFK